MRTRFHTIDGEHTLVLAPAGWRPEPQPEPQPDIDTLIANSLADEYGDPSDVEVEPRWINEATPNVDALIAAYEEDGEVPCADRPLQSTDFPESVFDGMNRDALRAYAKFRGVKNVSSYTVETLKQAIRDLWDRGGWSE